MEGQVFYPASLFFSRKESMRLTFDIEDSTHEILVKYLPHGLRKYAYKALIDGFASQLEEDAGPTLSALLGQSIDTNKLIREGTRS